MTLRILVTGSRHWRDHAVIRSKLVWALATYGMDGQGAVLVHGGQSSTSNTGQHYGADWIAEQEWMKLAENVPGGLCVEVHHADWKTHGRAAGPIRNDIMVAAGATVCLGFPIGESRGTWDCIRKAQKAGIHCVITEGATV